MVQWTLHHFQQMKRVLHLNCSLAQGEKVNHALYKVYPLLNCIKMTFPRYLELPRVW